MRELGTVYGLVVVVSILACILGGVRTEYYSDNGQEQEYESGYESGSNTDTYFNGDDDFIADYYNANVTCYDVWRGASHYNVCSPNPLNMLQPHSINTTKNVTWFIAPTLSGNQNLYIFECNVEVRNHPQVEVEYVLFDENGTEYSSNYPMYSKQWDNDGVIWIHAIFHSPFPLFLQIRSYITNNSGIFYGPPLGQVTIALRSAQSGWYLSNQTSSSYSITDKSWWYGSWILPKSEFLDSLNRYTQIISNCNVSSSTYLYDCPAYMGHVVTDCPYPIAGAVFNAKYELMTSALPNGQILHLGFPMQSAFSEILAIIGIIHDQPGVCNITTVTYSVTVVQINLEQVSTGLTCPPGQYRLFQIPYNPFNGERRPPLINMTVTLKPSCSGNSEVGLYYNKNQRMSGPNQIQATMRDVQTGPGACDPLKLVFSSDGPYEYFSVYNSGSETATFSITVAGPSGPAGPAANQAVWLTFVCIAGGLLAVILAIVAVMAIRRRVSYSTI